MTTMRSGLKTVLSTAALAWPLLCAAESAPLRPGLWEMSMQRDGVDQSDRMREMQEKMKNMSPEQREMMQKMLRQHGIGMDGGGKFKVCVTKENLDTDSWHQTERETNCTTQRSKSGKVWKWHSSCPAPNASESDGEANFISDTKYTMKVVTTTGEGGEKKTHTMTGQSTWLAADCGEVKPFTPPKKK
jgi:hypothetical protein